MAANILVIEDYASNLELMVALLEVAGFEVIQATTAELGIDLAKDNPPDLILMDLRLPGMDGLTATQILQKCSKTKDIPIIALTANVMGGAEAEALAMGCRRFITKPIDTRTFARTIAELIASSGS